MAQVPRISYHTTPPYHAMPYHTISYHTIPRNTSLYHIQHIPYLEVVRLSSAYPRELLPLSHQERRSFHQARDSPVRPEKTTTTTTTKQSWQKRQHEKQPRANTPREKRACRATANVLVQTLYQALEISLLGITIGFGNERPSGNRSGERREKNGVENLNLRNIPPNTSVFRGVRIEPITPPRGKSFLHLERKAYGCLTRECVLTQVPHWSRSTWKERNMYTMYF